MTFGVPASASPAPTLGSAAVATKITSNYMAWLFVQNCMVIGRESKSSSDPAKNVCTVQRPNAGLKNKRAALKLSVLSWSQLKLLFVSWALLLNCLRGIDEGGKEQRGESGEKWWQKSIYNWIGNCVAYFMASFSSNKTSKSQKQARN